MTSADNGTNGTALARTEQPKPPVPLSGPIADLDSAYRYASALAQADILPQDLRGKPSNVLTVLLYGQYLGIPPVIATQVISVVKGRPQLAGKFLMSKVRQAGHTPVVEHGDGECTVTITRGDTGEKHSETFTIANAVGAGLCTLTSEGKVRARSQKGEPLPWENYTRRMLMWRALGFCVDVICPEIKMGFGVEGEEYTADNDTPTPTLAQVVAQRADREQGTEQPAQQEPERDDGTIAAEVADIEAEYTARSDAQGGSDNEGGKDDEPELTYDEQMAEEAAAYEASLAQDGNGGQK